jgi:hexosaminidase
MNTISKYITLFILVISVFACEYTRKSPTGDEFLIRWKVDTNFLEGGGFRSVMTLVNQSDLILKNDWSLYFNLMRLIDTTSLRPEFNITHINGDFFKLSPTELFDSLLPGQETEITFDAQWSAIKVEDTPDGAYFVFNDGHIIPVLQILVEPFEREEQLNRSPNDVVPVPTPESAYSQNSYLTKLEPSLIGKIIPTPVSVTEGEGVFTLTTGTNIYYQSGLESEARYLSEALEPHLGTRLKMTEADTSLRENSIRLYLNEIEVEGELKISGDEVYVLSVTGNGIEIQGTDAAGVFYGIQSLRSLLPMDVWESRKKSIVIDAVTVRDAPGLKYRGLHLDVARNFQSVEAVKKLLDVMSLYKLNKFHFHLTDDEGWRLEIKAFPELTAIGGRRGHTYDESDRLVPSYGSGPYPEPKLSMGSGWYTQIEYIDILRYAAERHIEVIPEIDVPGHARAALVGMKARYNRLISEEKAAEADRYRIHDPDDKSVYLSIQRWSDNVINVCQESTYRFLEAVFDEIITMYRSAEAPLTSIHVGGDEVPHGVWEKSPACEILIRDSETINSVDDLMDYFFGKMESILSNRGLAMSAWEEFSLIKDPVTRIVKPNSAFIGRSIPYVWSNIWGTGTESYSYILANAGYRIVMSHASNFYFDNAYDKHPEEPGMYWAAFISAFDPYYFIPYDLYKSGKRDSFGHPLPNNFYARFEQLTEEGRQNIMGIQGQLWAENFRTPGRVEYMALPRIIPFAERAWVPEHHWMKIEGPEERGITVMGYWNEFANRLGHRELPRLDFMNGGYGYRIPPPGAIFQDGELRANVSYPGLTIRYTIDGSIPTASSPAYDEPVRVEGSNVITLRTFDTRGRGSRSVTVRGN